MNRISDIVTHNRIYRTLQHYLWEDGNLMAAGMSFYAVFAVFAGLFVGFSVIGIWLSNHDQLADALIAVINTTVPGLIGTEDALVDPNDLFDSIRYGWWGAIAFIGLSWTATGWMFYTRQAVRAIFQVPRDPRRYVVKKLWDLAMALGIGLLLVVSAVFIIVGTQFFEWFITVIGIGPSVRLTQAGATLISIAISVLINAVSLTAMFRVLPRLPIPKRSLLVGVTIGSLVLTALSVASGLVLNGAGRNPLLAGFTLFVAILVWFNLVSRVILLAASWIAVTLADHDVTLHTPTDAERRAALAHARRMVADDDVRLAREAYERSHGFFSKRSARARLKRAVARSRAQE